MATSDIQTWLEALDLAQYADAFAAADITPELCPALKDSDLEELGVHSLGHRRRIQFGVADRKYPSSPEMSVPAWVAGIPTVLAVGVDEYFREVHPVIRIWHVCDVAELTLRLLAIAGLSELRARDEATGQRRLARIIREVRLQIELPTLGKWQNISLVVAGHLEADSPSEALATLVRAELQPLLDGRPGESGEWSLRQLRNQLAHGGGITKARASLILQRWNPRIDRFLQALRVTETMQLVVRLPSGFGVLRGPSACAVPWYAGSLEEEQRVLEAFRARADIVLVGRNRCFGLWPLSIYEVPLLEEVGIPAVIPAPQVYVRRGEVRLVYTSIASPDTSYHTEGGETLWEFERLLRGGGSGEASGPAEEFKVAGFEVQLEREATQLVGRVREFETILRWAREGAAPLGLVLGGAGTGKSLLLARISAELADSRARRPEEPPTFAYRFKGGDERCNRESFLTFVAERLAVRLGRERPEGVPALSLVAALVREESRLLLILDGIDEIAEPDPGFIREILIPLCQNGARLLCAGRPDTRVRVPLEDAGAHLVFPEGLPLMSDGDIRTMILEKTGPLRRLFLRRDEDRGETVSNDILAQIIRAAGGLPLYVNYVIGDLLSRRLSIDALGQLPPTLTAYHERLLQRGQLGDLALVNTPLMATLCLAGEPLTPAGIAALLMAWGVLAEENNPAGIVERSLQAIEAMVRRASSPGNEVGFSPYHHTLRQHFLSSPETRHAVGRARQTFRRLSVAEGSGSGPDALGNYLRRHGAHHLATDGTAGETLAFVVAMRLRSSPIERQRHLAALNLALERTDRGADVDPAALFKLLLELHDGAEIAPGARALYQYHRRFLTSFEAEPLQLGFAVTYELAAEIADVERGQPDGRDVVPLMQWSADLSCPAQYAAANALGYLFMHEPNRVPAEVFRRLARSNPYDRMVVLNALMFRALEGRSPHAWVPEGPFWRSRWPYLSRDTALVRACQAHATATPSSDKEVEEIRRHLAAIDALAKDLAARPSIRADAELAGLVGRHWFAVSDLRSLRRFRERIVVHREWLDLGRLLLANPFWQIAGFGAEVLAQRFHSSRSDRAAVDAILAHFEPAPGTGLIGDRDTGMPDLARLTLLDESDSHLIAGRLGPFLLSPSAHQRAEAALHLTQLFRCMGPEPAEALIEALRPFLRGSDVETDIWAVHELVELHRAIRGRGFNLPIEFDLQSSPILRQLPGWEEMDYVTFNDTADQRMETVGVRS
jgi:hypothetical protein